MILVVGSHHWVLPVDSADKDARTLLALAETLDDEVMAIVHSDHTCTLDLGSRVIVKGVSKRKGLVGLWLLTRSCVSSASSPVVLVASDVAGALIAASLRSRRRNRRLVVNVQGEILDPGPAYGSRPRRQAIRSLMRLALRRADVVRCVTPALVQQARDIVPTSTVRYVGTRVDVDLFAFAEPRQDRAGRPLQLACVGSLTDLKNQRVLLQALALMPTASRPTLVLVGRGPSASELQELAVSLGVSANLDLRGQLPPHEVTAVLHASDVFVLPSLSEGQPRAVLEAWSTGRPAILSDIPAHRYLAERSGAALLTDPEDPKAWQRAIRKLQDDARLRARLGRDGASYVRHHHEEGAGLRAYASVIAEARAGV